MNEKYVIGKDQRRDHLYVWLRVHAQYSDELQAYVHALCFQEYLEVQKRQLGPIVLERYVWLDGWLVFCCLACNDELTLHILCFTTFSPHVPVDVWTLSRDCFQKTKLLT